MKRSIKMLIVTIGIAVFGISAKAQNEAITSGIYLNEKDYEMGKLTYVIHHNDRLELNEFLGGKNITVVYQGKKIKMPKSEIFGYRLDNRDYRFYHNEAYAILDTTGFMLYSRQRITQASKGFKAVNHYFFSLSANQLMMDLTIHNLEASFPESTDFRYSLQNYFRNDEDLISFDSAQKQYKLKYLYFDHKSIIAPHSAK